MCVRALHGFESQGQILNARDPANVGDIDRIVKPTNIGACITDPPSIRLQVLPVRIS